MTQTPLALADYLALQGQSLGPSSWMCITQPMIDRFADLTRDHQFIHIDTRAAAATPFGSTIAHGFLIVSLISAMAMEVVPAIAGTQHGVNYGFDRLRFVAPVPAGGRVRGAFTLASARADAGGRVSSHWSVTVEIDGHDKPALVADWLTMLFLTQEQAEGAGA